MQDKTSIPRYFSDTILNEDLGNELTLNTSFIAPRTHSISLSKSLSQQYAFPLHPSGPLEKTAFYHDLSYLYTKIPLCNDEIFHDIESIMQKHPESNLINNIYPPHNTSAFITASVSSLESVFASLRIDKTVENAPNDQFNDKSLQTTNFLSLKNLHESQKRRNSMHRRLSAVLIDIADVSSQQWFDAVKPTLSELDRLKKNKWELDEYSSRNSRRFSCPHTLLLFSERINTIPSALSASKIGCSDGSSDQNDYDPQEVKMNHFLFILTPLGKFLLNSDQLHEDFYPRDVLRKHKKQRKQWQQRRLGLPVKDTNANDDDSDISDESDEEQSTRQRHHKEDETTSTIIAHLSSHIPLFSHHKPSFQPKPKDKVTSRGEEIGEHNLIEESDDGELPLCQNCDHTGIPQPIQQSSNPITTPSLNQNDSAKSETNGQSCETSIINFENSILAQDYVPYIEFRVTKVRINLNLSGSSGITEHSDFFQDNHLVFALCDLSNGSDAPYALENELSARHGSESSKYLLDYLEFMKEKGIFTGEIQKDLKFDAFSRKRNSSSTSTPQSNVLNNDSPFNNTIFSNTGLSSFSNNNFSNTGFRLSNAMTNSNRSGPSLFVFPATNSTPPQSAQLLIPPQSSFVTSNECDVDEFTTNVEVEKNKNDSNDDHEQSQQCTIVPVESDQSQQPPRAIRPILSTYLEQGCPMIIFQQNKHRLDDSSVENNQNAILEAVEQINQAQTTTQAAMTRLFDISTYKQNNDEMNSIGDQLPPTKPFSIHQFNPTFVSIGDGVESCNPPMWSLQQKPLGSKTEESVDDRFSTQSFQHSIHPAVAQHQQIHASLQEAFVIQFFDIIANHPQFHFHEISNQSFKHTLTDFSLFYHHHCSNMFSGIGF